MELLISGRGATTLPARDRKSRGSYKLDLEVDTPH